MYSVEIIAYAIQMRNQEIRVIQT